MDEDAETRLRVTLLGAVEVRRGDTVVPVPGARLRGLLIRLALAGGRAVDAGVLVDALWPEEGPADPANALQTLVSRLRRVLGASDAVAQVEGGYRLGVADDDVDVLRFERLAAAGRERLRAGDPQSAAALLDEAGRPVPRRGGGAVGRHPVDRAVRRGRGGSGRGPAGPGPVGRRGRAPERPAR
ncbi:winged helix-turn-helix domain-containing protein [Micromonospora lupini]|uniref:AfsR/SARP family transcriptional regulator n=1 Tax=Micromonospora lupini TaxID=285679 RepID=UPI0033EDA42D